ncbi:hypothetical protein TNCV_51091 [Trichonephila clavipes]|nr:hypothetical protein TNCV_51091 [Trichonephila clavipes]
MATGSSLTQNHSRSQSEIQGDLHKGPLRQRWALSRSRSTGEPPRHFEVTSVTKTRILKETCLWNTDASSTGESAFHNRSIATVGEKSDHRDANHKNEFLPTHQLKGRKNVDNQPFP